MLNKIIKYLTSMKFMAILLLLFAGVIGYATFIENDFGRSSAKALIFNTWWFELLLLLLTVNLINNLIRFNVFRKDKLPALIFHLSFICILIGAGITRYFGYEGMMHIREKDMTNQFLSDDTFLQIHVNDKIHQYQHEKKLYLSAISSNNFNHRVNFKENDIKITYSNFLPNVEDSIIEDVINGKKMLHLVVPGDDGMQSEYLFDQQRKIIKGKLFTFNNPIEGGINFIGFAGDSVICDSPFEVSTMSMLTRKTELFDSKISFRVNTRTLHTVDGLNFVLKEYLEKAKKEPYSSSPIMKDGSLDALIINIVVNGIEKDVVLYGGKGFLADKKDFVLDDLNFRLSYGSKHYTTPFYIKLNDFQLERYPGSMSPSSFAAEITVVDSDNMIPYRIYMNNVLQYRGYRFFQSSYDKDEKGTILSVNHDWFGTVVTYIGYFFLMLGFILVFFYKKTRYNMLNTRLQKKYIQLLFFGMLFISSPAYSQDIININHANNFEKLVVQDNGGRLKPANTLCSEYLRKIYGKDRFKDQNSTQVILGMINDPISWSDVDLIKITSDKLINLLEVEKSKSRYTRVSFNDFFAEDGSYILAEEVESAYAKEPKDHSQHDKDIIKVDEKVNICFIVFGGGIFRLFPLPNDSNNTWLPYTNSSMFQGNDSLFVANIMPMYFSSIKQSMISNNWSTSDSVVSYIRKYQMKKGLDVIPASSLIDLEIIYNKLRLFSRLFPYYSMIGLLLIFFVIMSIFRDNSFMRSSIIFLKWLIITGFVAHTLGLVMRWVISGHAPWSNGYESMIYIAWATILAGIIFSLQSKLTIGVTAVVSSLLLMVAHLNWLDPEITNLVPVLNSYWLMIHVAIITASYGFLACGALLGFLSLWLMVLSYFLKKENKKKIGHNISELTIINEKSLQIGLFMLTIGTFLGGVWANESWGRYWGWDPKETWALVSILVYAFVLHMRFIPPLNNTYTFNFMSLCSISSIIMTYFGVNYYLSGLHSYAAGDPMPIPMWIYYFVGIVILTGIFARFTRKELDI